MRNKIAHTITSLNEAVATMRTTSYEGFACLFNSNAANPSALAVGGQVDVSAAAKTLTIARSKHRNFFVFAVCYLCFGRFLRIKLITASIHVRLPLRR